MFRNDKPVDIGRLNSFSANGGYNFGTDSVLNNLAVTKSMSTFTPSPPLNNFFLLLEAPTSHFLLLDGTDFLLLGT